MCLDVRSAGIYGLAKKRYSSALTALMQMQGSASICCGKRPFRAGGSQSKSISMKMSSLRLLKLPCLAIAIAIATPVAYADQACYEKAQNQAQLTACASSELKQADDRLNHLYRQVQDRLKGDEDVRKLLVDSQRKWLAFRDAECTFQTMRSSGGTINAMNVNSCLAGLTQARAKDLQIHLDCTRQADEQEAADCAIPRAN